MARLNRNTHSWENRGILFSNIPVFTKCQDCGVVWSRIRMPLRTKFQNVFSMNTVALDKCPPCTSESKQMDFLDYLNEV